MHLIKPDNNNITGVNKERFKALQFAMNESEAIVFLAIGVHYDHANKVGLPVITGSQWMSREEAIDLLQKALTAMNTKIIEDAQSQS